jgi:hypothetical protein
VTTALVARVRAKSIFSSSFDVVVEKYETELLADVKY